MIVTIIKILILLPVTLFFSVAALIAIPLDRSGRLFRWVPRTWSRFILWLFRIRVHVEGMEHGESGGSFVFVSNHASMFDIPAVLVGLPRDVNLVFKKELVHVPIWGWALRWGHFIMIDRSNPREALQSLDRAAETIRNGASVLLFAEGTRTRDGRLQPFKRGAFTLAAKSGRPIIPVTINNAFRIMPKGSLNVRPSDIHLVLSPPVATAGMEGRTGEQELMAAVYAAISTHYHEQD